MAKIIFGIGNPLLDISVEVQDDELLDKYGLRVNNAVLVTPEQQAVFDDVLEFENKLFIAGGAACNSMRAAQWMLGTPESNTYYGGCIGSDEVGQHLIDSLNIHKVRNVMMINPDVPTGRCAVIIKGKERSLAASVNAAATYTPDHLETDLVRSALSESDFIYTTGYFISSTAESVVNLGKYAAEHGKNFSVNISAEFVPQFLGGALADAISYADFVFCNETEAAVYANTQNFTSTEIPEIAKFIATPVPKAEGKSKRVSIITCGSSETVYSDGENTYSVAVQRIDPSSIVDTNGAGDSFVGGFLAGLAHGKDIEQSIRAGHYCAGFTIQRSGTNFEGSTSEFNWN
jgi:adenosine kinase